MTTTDAPALSPGEVLAVLADYGTARKIADFLIERGCGGIPEHPHSCPVANYIRSVTGLSVEVDGCEWIDIDGRTHWTPAVVVDFVMKFDDGAYPGLVVEGRELP